MARRFDLIAIEALGAELKVARDPVGGVVVSGRLSATVSQRCVVTLEPVVAELDESFVLRFAVDAGAPGPDLLIGVDDPEPLPDGPLDLGELVAQQLALALPPYPRAPGAALELAPAAPVGAGAGGQAEQPFAVLKQLRGVTPDKP